MKRFNMLLLVFLALAPLRVGAQMLRVEGLQGAVELTRGGGHADLSESTALLSDDVIRLGSDARASLRLGRHGVLELGANSELQIERVPFASYADDLRTVVRLRRGYLRVIWKEPPLDVSWPIFIYMDSDRTAISDGEFFFQVSVTGNAVCLADGQLLLAGASREAAETLEPNNCYRLKAGSPPLPIAHTPDVWSAVRENYALDPELWSDSQRGAEPSAIGVPGVALPAGVLTRATPVSETSSALADARYTATPAQTGTWSVKLPALSTPEAASQEVQRLKQAGFPSATQGLEGSGGNDNHVFRVVIPGLSDAAQAQETVTQLRAAGFPLSWVVRPPG